MQTYRLADMLHAFVRHSLLREDASPDAAVAPALSVIMYQHHASIPG
ncbi:hypothetical protein ASZ90_008979 [hydrocarbon metagenome]|uniref:Uncharacterized protein n=1 Tax=hydrocarbon metagenome TaxID=938273 RepID=A0A0W8FK33_9ZZZZ